MIVKITTPDNHHVYVNAGLFNGDPDHPVVDISPTGVLLVESVGASTEDLADFLGMAFWHGSDRHPCLTLDGYTYEEASPNTMIEIDPDTSLPQCPTWLQ